MQWKMYEDGKARVNIRSEHQLTVRDIALIIADDTTMDGKHEKLTDTEDLTSAEYEYVEWTQKDIEEKVRYELERFGYDTIRAHNENLGDWLNENEEKKKRLEVAKQVVAEKFGIDELREKYGYESRYRKEGGSRMKDVNVKSHTRITRKGKPTKVKSHKRSRPKR